MTNAEIPVVAKRYVHGSALILACAKTSGAAHAKVWAIPIPRWRPLAVGRARYTLSRSFFVLYWGCLFIVITGVGLLILQTVRRKGWDIHRQRARGTGGCTRRPTRRSRPVRRRARLRRRWRAVGSESWLRPGQSACAKGPVAAGRQRAKLHAEVAAAGWTVREWVEDVHQSGTTLNRPGLRHALALLADQLDGVRVQIYR